MKHMHSVLNFCSTTCLVLLISGCVVFGDDENVPGTLSDAADASDVIDASDAADSSDPSTIDPACSEETPCADGFYCLDEECVPQETNGSLCSDEQMCASGFCVDGVCCESACDGICSACSAALTGGSNDNGVCAAIPAGEDPADECGVQQCNGALECFDLQEGDDCGFDYECGGELVCNLGVCGENVCGDGVQRGQEECDDGNLSNNDACLTDCRNAFCGDGFQRFEEINSKFDPVFELCDDAGESESCDDDCTFSFCGDGNTNQSAGESCDASGESAECDVDCTPAECGDSLTNQSANEACDDGNTLSLACNYNEQSCEVCSPECILEAGTTSYCGDGWVDTDNGEQCELSGTFTTECAYGEQSCSLCNEQCQYFEGSISYCGDGNTDAGYEACDDGNLELEICEYGLESCSVCNPSCEWVSGETSYCGDTLIDSNHENCDEGDTETEECDYGLESCRVCNSTCQEQDGITHYCGDGATDNAYETCDDGNTQLEACAYGLQSCTVCNSNCQNQNGVTHYCGDNTIDEDYEECDEGSYSNGVTTDLFHGCPNCESTVCEGDFLVTSGSNNDIENCNVIDGNLTIQAYYWSCDFCAVANYSFDQIYQVTGSVTVVPQSPAGLGWVDGLSRLNLDNLRVIGESLRVERYQFCVGQDCTYHENEELLEVSMERLLQVTNTLKIGYNPSLNKFWVPDLMQAGTLDITYNPNLCLVEEVFGQNPWQISYSDNRTINNNKTTGCD
ncbi:MAG: hypothetical protein HOK28_11560 [Deltaproteobacteria bacterium]|nr:hypothetical protein [Deltaproteobacteria bacterium]